MIRWLIRFSQILTLVVGEAVGTGVGAFVGCVIDTNYMSFGDQIIWNSL